MTNEANMPIYPAQEIGPSGAPNHQMLYGLTKREHYAGLAMQALLASGKFQVDGEMCREAWSAADQMLWQQEKDNQQ